MFLTMILSTLISAYSYSPSNVSAIFHFQQSADMNTLTDALANELKQAGYSVVELNADSISDSSMLINGIYQNEYENCELPTSNGV